jgi:hypothetical protein
MEVPMDAQKSETTQIEASQEGAPEPATPAGEDNIKTDTIKMDVTETKSAAPTRPSFRERLAVTFEPARERLAPGLSGLRDWLATGNWIYGLIAALVIAALLLPPISLPRRLGLTGFTRVNANTPYSHPDGLTINMDASSRMPSLAGAAGDVQGSIRLNVTSIPRLVFLEGSAGDDLVAARDAIPPILEIKSPFYQIESRSHDGQPVALEVTIPNEAEPWETLDLYAWNGETWEWLGGLLDWNTESLVATVTEIPPALAVMQTSPVVPAIETISETAPEAPEAEILTHILAPGLYLGTDGMLLGQAPAISLGGPETILLVRNWQPDQPASVGLMEDVLSNDDIQTAHIENVVAAATGAGATGVAIDYKGVAVEQREAFAGFIIALAEVLHAENMRLEIAVPAPTPATDGVWNTGGYDWAALGAEADAILLPLPEDPAAYAPGGEVESLLHWAVSQVNRYKIHAMVTSLSVDTTATAVQRVSLENALAPFGQIQAPANAAPEPGAEVSFTLAGQVNSIVRDEAAGTYVIAYQQEETAHNVWLGTPSFLARKLDWALTYHLSGVVVENVMDSGNMAGIANAVADYRAAAGMPQPTELEVAWTVSGPETIEQTVTLSQPDFNWTVPETAGTYTVAAAIAGVSRGSLEINVAAAEPTSTPEPEEEEEDGGAETGDSSCLGASFVTDVTVPDGTQYEKGEAFVKTWRLQNSGTCDWPESTVLVVSYSQLGGEEEVTVGTVAVGESVDISIDLAAPDEDGNFDGLWLLMADGAEIPGGAVTAVIQAGAGAAGIGASTPTVVQPVASGSFELGGHVRDLSLPYADLMHYAGMNWTKIQVHYGQDVSSLIANAHANGFKIQLSALGSPSMVTQGGFEQNFANWVAQMAAAGADAIEVWNEPNIGREWQEGYINPQAYTNLLCTAYSAIKAANPGTAVISAAPAPTGWFGGCGPNGCDDQPWLEGMAAAGAAGCMDYIGAHHNAGATSPSATTGHPADDGNHHHSWYFLPQTQLYYNIFGGSRQLFYTEMGYASQEGLPTFSDAFAWARGTNNVQQAAWLAEAVQLSVNTGMVRNIIVWNIDFQRYDYDPQDGYAIVRPGGSCPACDSLHGVLGTR